MLDDIWRFRLLGDFQAQQGPTSTDRFRTRKTAALLAYLAFHHHKAHTREELATLLWPDATPELGLKSLGVALSSLRKLLEPPGVPAGTVLIADRRTARVAAQAIHTDVAAFREALELARQAADITSRRMHLETAIGVYCGELLPGFYEDWIPPERDLLALAYRRALEELIGLLETSGQTSEALSYALKHAAGDPYDEKSYARVMRLYVSAGEPAEALRHYNTLEQRLREDLDEQPSEETRGIAKNLHAAYGERRDAPMESPPLSEADASVPALQSREVRLPLILTQFFGRESEIERLQELFKQRLITLTGPGGSGKTRLAVEAIRRFSERYDGRILFVPLADLSIADEIPSTIRKVLRLPNIPGASAEMELTAALGTKPTLLLLDNLEHLLPVPETKETHSARRFIFHLLEQVPSLTVVATSRQPLGLAGEQEFPIKPLPTPPVEDASRYVAPEEAMAFACIQLFADRARLKLPDFHITLRNVKTVAAICRRLDGIPLALELAGGLTRVLPPEAMLQRLSRTQEELVSRQKDTPERHKSLYSAVEWSYRLLSPRLQSFFRRLSVFRGSWTVEVAEAVCEEPEALESMALLEERSLILAEPREDKTGYRMLETIREYGYESLRKHGEDSHVRALHASYFMKLAETHRLAGAMLEVMPAERVALHMLEDQYQNIGLALDWLLEEAGQEDRAVRLAAILGRFWILSRRLREGAERLDGILPLARNSNEILPLCDILLHAGGIAWFRGDYVRSVNLWEELLTTSRKHTLPHHEAVALEGLGVLAAMRGETKQRDFFFGEAIALCRRLEDHSMLAWSLMSLGWLLVGQKQDRQAMPLLEESLSIYARIGDRLQSAWCQMYIALITSRSGSPAAAHAIAQQALSAFQEEDSAGGQLWMLLHMSTIAIALSDLEHAAVLLGQVKGLLSRSGVELPPAESTEYEENLAHIRASLPEQDGGRALARGFALNLEQAVEYALSRRLDSKKFV